MAPWSGYAQAGANGSRERLLPEGDASRPSEETTSRGPVETLEDMGKKAVTQILDHIDSSVINETDNHPPPDYPRRRMSTFRGTDAARRAVLAKLGHVHAPEEPVVPDEEDLPAEERDWKDDVVTFDSKEDPANPKNWTFRRKVAVVYLLAITTLCSTLASSIYSPAMRYIAEEFNVSTQYLTWGTTLFLFGFIPGPVVFAPLSETYGRKHSVLPPLIVFVCFEIATATAKTVDTIFVTRFFAGVFASAPVTNIGGGLSDMFDQRDRAVAVVLYSMAVIGGPLFGPIIGSTLSVHFGWRSTQWLVVIMTLIVVSVNTVILPETFSPVILTDKARRLRLKTRRWALHSKAEESDTSIEVFIERNLFRPIQMLLFEPICLAFSIFNAFSYGILYLLLGAIPVVFQEGRGWDPIKGSLPFFFVFGGVLVAAVINIVYSREVYAKRLDAVGSKELAPEVRLPPMMLGSITFPIGFFLLGWTSDPSTHWLPSCIGLLLIGMSFLLIFQSGLNFLIDTYSAYAASAVAANTFMRSAAAGALPLAAKPLFHTLGIAGGCSLLGGLAIGLAIVPFLFHWYGAKLRSMSKMAMHGAQE